MNGACREAGSPCKCYSGPRRCHLRDFHSQRFWGTGRGGGREWEKHKVKEGQESILTMSNFQVEAALARSEALQGGLLAPCPLSRGTQIWQEATG